MRRFYIISILLTITFRFILNTTIKPQNYISKHFLITMNNKKIHQSAVKIKKTD